MRFAPACKALFPSSPQGKSSIQEALQNTLGFQDALVGSGYLAWKSLFFLCFSLCRTLDRSWADLDLDACQEVLLELYRDGKLHQPRLYGKYPIRMDNHWGVIAPFPTSAF